MTMPGLQRNAAAGGMAEVELVTWHSKKRGMKKNQEISAL